MTVKRNTFDTITTYEEHLFFYLGFLSDTSDSMGTRGRGWGDIFIHFYQFSILANIQIFLYSLASDLAYVTTLFDEIYSRLTSGN